LKPGARRERSTAQSSSSIPHPMPEVKIAPSFNSKIVSDVAAIHRLFDAKVASLKLIFRASENGFSIKEFHKKCDGQSGTITLI